MYFHQDDLDWFLLAHKPFADIMNASIGDHVNYLFRILLKIEWSMFHLYFPGYLMVSVIMHAGVVWLVYKLSLLTSERRDLSAYAALLFTINTNWTEVVLWISGQTISITVIFVLMSMFSIWKKRGEVVSLFLASWTSALALGLPIAAILTYGIDFAKKRISRAGYGAIGSMFLVLILIMWKRSDGTELELSLLWAKMVVEVWGLAMINSVLGRLLIPFDSLEIWRIGGVCLLIVGGAWKYREQIIAIWRDSWSRFLIVQMSVYYLIVAVGRAQYGVGIMRAERYAYLGLALFLLLLSRVLRKAQLGRWIWVVPLLLIIQSIGLYRRAEDYVVRPQQLKRVVEEVLRDVEKIDENAYLPHFVLNDERLRYSDLMMLIND